MASQTDTYVHMEKLEEAQDKGKESHTMWHQAILGKNLRQQQQGVLGKCGGYNAPCSDQ
jgi:hypothetical protein